MRSRTTQANGQTKMVMDTGIIQQVIMLIIVQQPLEPQLNSEILGVLTLTTMDLLMEMMHSRMILHNGKTLMVMDLEMNLQEIILTNVRLLQEPL